MLNAKRIIEKYSSSLSKKSTVDSKYKEVFRYVMPDRDNYNYPQTDGDNFDSKRNSIYSNVGVNAAMSFVNRIQSSLTPIKGDWIELKANELAENREEVDLELEKLAKICNMYKNISNFDQIISEFYGDLVAGTACLMLQKGTPKNPLMFRAIPIKDLTILEGVEGQVSYVFRKFETRKENLKAQWVELKGMEISADEADKNVSIIECTNYDYDTEQWTYYVVDQEKEKILVERPYAINPFITLRWFKCTGELYGRGVGLQAIDDIRTLNLMTQYALRSAAYALPTFMVQEDAVFDPDEFVLEPGALNPISDVNAIQPLQVNTNIDVNRLNLQELEAKVKKTMLNNVLPDKITPGVTATEIAERSEQDQVNISSVFGRLENEFLVPLVKGIINTLQQFKLVDSEFDISELDGLGFRVVVNTPLAKAQQQRGVMNVVRAASILAQFDPTGQVLANAFKTEELVPYLLDGMGTPANLYNTSKEYASKRDQSAQAGAQMEEQSANADAKRQMAIDDNKEQAKQQ